VFDDHIVWPRIQLLKGENVEIERREKEARIKNVS
jgi:hypothetical protein